MKPRTLFYLSLLFLLIIYNSRTNNSCQTYTGYFNIFFSSDCYYTPDLEDDIFGIIRRHIGVSEVHEVRTEDGYILTLIRIPRENPKGIVFIQHPVSTDATIWVAQYNTSLPFVLWKAGYDVWLSNSRGTYYSQKHVKISTSEKAFWNYSMDEMGYYDHHVTIPYISKKTNSKVTYIGMSMGASSGLIYAITRSAEAADMLNLMVAISPVSYLKNGKSALRYIMPVIFYFQEMITDPYFPITGHHYWYMKLFRFLARIIPLKKCILYFFICPLFGWTPDETDPNLIMMMISKYGSEISFKVYRQFYQFYKNDGLFYMYDYGEKENLKVYGSKIPPLYHPEKIKIPVIVVSGENDNLVDPLDNQELYSKLSEEAKLYGTFSIKGFNHQNIIDGRHRTENLYAKILYLLDQVN